MSRSRKCPICGQPSRETTEMFTASRCLVCRHPDCEAINAALVAGEPHRNISQRFQLSEDALERHNREHYPAIRPGDVIESYGLECVVARQLPLLGGIVTEDGWLIEYDSITGIRRQKAR